MKMVRKRFVALLVAFALLLSHGCKKEDDSQASIDSSESAQTPPANQTVETETSINDLVLLWDTGKKGEATEKFLSTDWQDAAVFKQTRGFSMSEADLKSLSENEIKGIVGETTPLLGSMRKLFFHVASEAKVLASSGNQAKAEEYLNTIREYGKSLTGLTGSDYLHMVQMHGKAAVAYAETKLSEIKQPN